MESLDGKIIIRTLNKVTESSSEITEVYETYDQIFENLYEVTIPKEDYNTILKSVIFLLKSLKNHNFGSQENYFFKLIAVYEYVASLVFQASITNRNEYNKHSVSFFQIANLLLESYRKFKHESAIKRFGEYNSFKGNELAYSQELEFDPHSEPNIKLAIKKNYILPLKYDIIENKLSNNGFVPIIYNNQIIYQKRSKSFKGSVTPEKVKPVGFFYDQLHTILPKTQSEFIGFIVELIQHFKHSIEQRQGYKILWNNYEPKSEDEIQIYFDNIIHELARKNGIEVNRETQTGRGFVDFKFTESVEHQAHLEIKKSDNQKLKKGFSKQVPTYLKADKMKLAFYVVIFFNEQGINTYNKLEAEAENFNKENNIKILLFKVDARKNKKSASKL